MRIGFLFASTSSTRFTGVLLGELFTISGFVYALSAILLVSRIGSIRPNIATGFEIEVITIIVFGGAAIYGGSGTIFGFLLSLLIIGYLRFGLALVNVSGQIMLMISGFLLIIAIVVNNFIRKFRDRRISNI